MNELDAIRKVVKIVGGQSALARKLGTRQGRISAWILRDGRVGASYALMCHYITNGEVSAHDLRPDLYPPTLVAIAEMSFPKVQA